MNTLCFAMILAQAATDLPPPHIQTLLKKKILYQLKQTNPDLEFFFDEPTCSVVGSYNFKDDNFELSSSDHSLDLKFPYSDVLQGKALELSRIVEVTTTKANIIAATSSPEQPALPPTIAPTTAGAAVKKWLPWALGAAGVGLSGLFIYKQTRGKRNGGDTQNARTFH